MVFGAELVLLGFDVFFAVFFAVLFFLAVAIISPVRCGNPTRSKV